MVITTFPMVCIFADVAGIGLLIPFSQTNTPVLFICKPYFIIFVSPGAVGFSVKPPIRLEILLVLA